ncbi:regulator of chromosome condensation, putative [Ichthyophthirius multifiliis]|uniref:Regulator of chromosome condensation, putative n=1 Tax=Ichthyophthirius multifiliis TaxID=5932 RepID=G0QSS1_ICHMU|nr:regulator of chromosome condensation, putative [Ichthyophthirius multifiliis]EGR31729.1 regulator of chromosome condensation, putative [Ichthyophthirius multifiliis]|eukprot:XP_004035215.1 regulator of chromosome condensation, putative [Ichthyophthirius multifiliis]
MEQALLSPDFDPKKWLQNELNRMNQEHQSEVDKIVLNTEPDFQFQSTDMQLTEILFNFKSKLTHSLDIIDSIIQLDFHMEEIKDKTELWTFGSGILGQLGIDRIKFCQNKPFNISKLTDKHFSQIAVSSTHTVGISTQKKLFGWGSTEFCSLGELTDQKLKLSVMNNKLFSFGKEDFSRLGLGQINIKHTEKPVQIKITPKLIKIQGIACGKNHCLMWNQAGQIYSWGDGTYGKLGHSSVNGSYNYMVAEPQLDYLRPKVITGYFKSSKKNQSCSIFVKISSYGNQNAAIDQKGFLYTWGQNNHNCLGHQESIDYNYPLCLEEFNQMQVIDVGCGKNFTVVIYQTPDQYNSQYQDQVKSQVLI